MKILVGMMHPKHVHMFKNLIWEMEKKGHSYEVLSIEKDVTETLLRKYNFTFSSIGINNPSLYSKIMDVPKWEYHTLKKALKFKPDVFIGQAFPHFAHVSAILRKPFYIFEDSEPANVVQFFTLPFANAVITPNCYRVNLGRKQIFFNGYYELAYLHPNYFKPDFRVIERIGIEKNEPFFIFRFVSWSAVHDLGQKGFDLAFKRKIVSKARKEGRVFISSEKSLPRDLEKYRIRISPEEIHHFLYFAQLLISDSQTMTTEAGVLGTPAIRCNSFVGANDMGNFVELEKKYGLIINLKEQDEVVDKFQDLIHIFNLKKEWNYKRERMLRDKIDVTKFMVNFIEKKSPV